MHHSSDPIVSHVARIMTEHTQDQTMPSLIVAVSGGLDSLVLLHTLAAQRDQQPFRLHVATFDHGWRAESAVDATFVQDIAAAWGLECTIGRMVAPDKTPLGREAAARAARYDFLAQVALEQGAIMIATAHHADDQVETILLHLLRGTGTHGLQGMPPLAPLPDSDDLWLLRPLLEIPRDDLAAYAQRHNLTSRHDSSNDNPRYKRNALRQEIVPQLKRFNPKFTHNLLRLASIVRDEQSYLTQMLRHGLLAYGEQMPYRWQVPRDRFWQEHIALQKRYIWQAAQTLSKAPQDVTYERIMAVVTMVRERRMGARIEIPGGVIAYINQVHFVIEKITKSDHF
jgi:tRNA(Ile)-lysidine synthase